MSAPQQALVTAEDYQRLPDSPRYQLVEGELIMAPAPNRYHQEISGNLAYLLRSHLRKNPIGKIYHAPFDVYLDEHNVFQPDILYVSKERYGILVEKGAEGAPDMIVEILSPSNARIDLEQKKDAYTRHGVLELWIVVPETRQVQIYRLREQAERPAAVYEQIDTFESPLLPGLRLKAAEIFEE